METEGHINDKEDEYSTLRSALGAGEIEFAIAGILIAAFFTFDSLPIGVMMVHQQIS